MRRRQSRKILMRKTYSSRPASFDEACRHGGGLDKLDVQLLVAARDSERAFDACMKELLDFPEISDEAILAGIHRIRMEKQRISELDASEIAIEYESTRLSMASNLRAMQREMEQFL